MPKTTIKISSEQRLQTYSKQTLIELVLELRDRFDKYNEEVRTAQAAADKYKSALESARRELNETRKKNRALMKGGRV